MEEQKMKNLKFNLIKVFLIPVFIVYMIPARLCFAQVAIKDLNISMMLVNQKDGSTIKVLDNEIELAIKTIIYEENNTIDNILISNGIIPDGESLGILYLINPGIDEDSIKTNTTLQVPIIKKKEDTTTIYNEAYLVALTLDKEIKKDLIKEFSNLRNFMEQIATIQADQFGSSTDKEKFIQNVSFVAEKIEAFKVALMERTRPFSSEMIKQIYNEVKQINIIFNKLINDKKKLTNTEFEVIELINENMEIRMRALNEKKGPSGLPSRCPEISVVVKTIDPKQDKKEIYNLRIYYVSRALWENRKDFEESFDKLSSPTDRMLPEANYYIWAGKANDSTPVSDIKPLKVRKTEGIEIIEVELVIK
jgi:hypothetical protein